MMQFYRCLLLLLWFFSVPDKADGMEENAARLGTTTQSSLYYGWYPQYVIDGIRTSCSHTLQQTNPWWKLDLLKTYSVNRVLITNRIQVPERLNGAQIRVGNDGTSLYSNPICAVIPSIPSGETDTYSCHGMEGRYVYVVIPGDSKFLTLCEVEVYGVMPGNLAVGQNATQSSTNGLWFAEQAIDSNRGLLKSSSACSSTNSENYPWWRLDLRHVYEVSRVVITNRVDCCPEEINGAEIRIGNSLESNGNINPICDVISSIPAGVSTTFFCNNMEGRYVNLIIPADSRVLTLCEVEVYGTGPLLKESFMKIHFKYSASLTEPAIQVNILTQLETALAKVGISDVVLRWSMLPKSEVQNQAKQDQCVRDN
ncbi:uncharacterized protein LOC127453106 [Myxocyprinus asiaticus]|uniref:uncharacterized protein LOC127453106 n=1 Tax=Myxocyprinus asiaticus TaxID=70543 RepID=UPI0022222AD9|nr:uncharacterized protein LOC127453106 [Myxocyprinus asiaticus]